jgi:hypothetical protein
MKYLRIAMLVLGMVMVIGGGTLFAKNYLRTSEVHGWPRTQARITDSRVDTLHRQEVGNEGDFMPDVRYDYTVGGRTYHGNTMWLDEQRSFGSANVASRELAFLEEGTETEVFYNPQNPREAALLIDKPSWRYFFVALLGGLLGWMGWRLRSIQPPPRPMPQMQPGQGPQPMPQAQAQVPPQVQAQPQMQPQLPPQMQARPKAAAPAPMAASAQVRPPVGTEVQMQQPSPVEGRIVSSVRAAPSS